VEQGHGKVVHGGQHRGLLLDPRPPTPVMPAIFQRASRMGGVDSRHTLSRGQALKIAGMTHSLAIEALSATLPWRCRVEASGSRCILAAVIGSAARGGDKRETRQ